MQFLLCMELRLLKNVKISFLAKVEASYLSKKKNPDGDFIFNETL